MTEVLCGNSQGAPSLPGPQAHLRIRDRTLGVSVNQLPSFTAPFTLAGKSTARRRIADLSYSPRFRHSAEKHQFSLFQNHYSTFSNYRERVSVIFNVGVKAWWRVVYPKKAWWRMDCSRASVPRANLPTGRQARSFGCGGDLAMNLPKGRLRWIIASIPDLVSTD